MQALPRSLLLADYSRFLTCDDHLSSALLFVLLRHTREGALIMH